MIHNSLFAHIPDHRMRRLVAALEFVNKELDFLISLKPLERQSVQPISDARLPYVLKCVEFCLAHRVKIGMSLEDLVEFKTTARLFEQLTQLFNLSDDLRIGLRDTQMMVGNNLYRMARGAHSMMRIASRKGRSGTGAMVEELNILFAKQGNRKQRRQQADEPTNPNLPGSKPKTGAA